MRKLSRIIFLAVLNSMCKKISGSMRLKRKAKNPKTILLMALENLYMIMILENSMMTSPILGFLSGIWKKTKLFPLTSKLKEKKTRGMCSLTLFLPMTRELSSFVMDTKNSSLDMVFHIVSIELLMCLKSLYKILVKRTVKLQARNW